MNKVIEQSRILFLDTSAVVRLLQMHPDFYPVVSSVLDYAYEKNVTILTSSVTLFELSRKACVAGRAFLPASTVSSLNIPRTLNSVT